MMLNRSFGCSLSRLYFFWLPSKLVAWVVAMLLVAVGCPVELVALSGCTALVADLLFRSKRHDEQQGVAVCGHGQNAMMSSRSFGCSSIWGVWVSVPFGYSSSWLHCFC
jgi:hypothetical protein